MTEVKNVMTPREFADEMRNIEVRCGNDLEYMHRAMVGLMEYVLTQLGYEEGTEVFDSVYKRYS